MSREELFEMWKLLRFELVITGLLEIPIFIGLWYFQYFMLFWIILILSLIINIRKCIKIIKIEKKLGIYDLV